MNLPQSIVINCPRSHTSVPRTLPTVQYRDNPDERDLRVFAFFLKALRAVLFKNVGISTNPLLRSRSLLPLYVFPLKLPLFIVPNMCIHIYIYMCLSLLKKGTKTDSGWGNWVRHAKANAKPPRSRPGPPRTIHYRAADLHFAGA